MFDEWVRHDVGRIYVQTFEASVRNWLGMLDVMEGLGPIFMRTEEAIQKLSEEVPDEKARKKKLKEHSNKDSTNDKPRKGNKSLVPQKEVPQECVGDSFKREQRADASVHHVHASSACCMGKVARPP